MNNSGSSSATPVCAPLKKLRATPAVPALAATLENIEQHNKTPRTTLNVSSGSDILSIASSQERNQRVALAKARQQTARLRLELAVADEDVVQTEMDHARAGSQAGSVGRLTDVRSEGERRQEHDLGQVQNLPHP
jgi:NADPH-dependent ferric siderophore reductase